MDKSDPNVTNQFLLTCLRGAWDPSALASAHKGAAKHIDWNQFRKIIQSQRIGPLLYETLRDQKVLQEELVDHLRLEYLHSALRNSLLIDELIVVLGAFQSAGVIVMPFKGAALIGSIYANPATRPIADLDLLIPPRVLDAATAIFASLNYHTMDVEPWPGYSGRYRQVQEFSRRTDDGFIFLIDLHWGLVDVPYYKRVPIESWFNRSCESDIKGNRIRRPAHDDHFLGLCSHLAIQERYDKALLRYCDLAMLIAVGSSPLEWGTIIHRAIEWRFVLPLQRSLEKLNDLWPATVPSQILEDILTIVPSSGERRIQRWLIDRPRNATSDVLLSAVTTSGAANKIRLLLEQAFPSPEYMRKRYNLQGFRLWPLLYLWRVFLGIRFLARN